MPNEYVAIDFETANSDRSSACAIGMVLIRGTVIVDQQSHLIKPSIPFFDPYNIGIHGITEDDVANAPEMDELWPRLETFIGGRTLVAHSAGFDMSVLRWAFDEYDMPYPPCNYYCTRLFSMVTWPGLVSYGLRPVEDHLGVKFKHHDPAEDARACAEIAALACSEKNVPDMDGLAEALNIRMGILTPDDWSAPHWRYSGTVNYKALSPADTNINPGNYFYGKKVVFTGTLQSMTRSEAAQRVVDLGAKCAGVVSKKTNFLILGDQDFTKLRSDRKSAKMRTAEKLAMAGYEIEILPEYEFLRMLP